MPPVRIGKRLHHNLESARVVCLISHPPPVGRKLGQTFIKPRVDYHSRLTVFPRHIQSPQVSAGFRVKLEILQVPPSFDQSCGALSSDSPTATPRHRPHRRAPYTGCKTTHCHSPAIGRQFWIQNTVGIRIAGGAYGFAGTIVPDQLLTTDRGGAVCNAAIAGNRKAAQIECWVISHSVGQNHRFARPSSTCDINPARYQRALPHLYDAIRLKICASRVGLCEPFRLPSTQRWNAEEATRSRGTKQDRALSIHVPPRPWGASANACSCAPLMSTRYSLPEAKNPIDRLSLDENGYSEVSVSGKGCA